MPKKYTHSERIKAFWSKVKINDLFDCWTWTGSKLCSGYGMVKWDGMPQPAHRVSWQIVFGDIPEGFCVCHRCDNPVCVNPAHLFLGTHTDNMRDMVQKGRCGTAKLTLANIVAIRKLRSENWELADIASKFSVTPESIGRIVNRETWKHI